MSEKPISVGDLVMVVHHCCAQKGLGAIFRVSKLTADWRSCRNCGSPYGSTWAYAGSPMGDIRGAPVAWLKRIDPPADARSEDARKPVDEKLPA